MKRQAADCDDLFLPDFCGIRMVFVVVIIAELAAFVLALAPLDIPLNDRWSNLGLISLYVQWCALTSSGLLCVLRPYMCRFTDVQVGIISYLLILAVIAGVSEAAYWFIHHQALADNSGWHLRFLFRNLVIGAIITGPILRYFYVQNQWRRNVKTESEARLQALQSRIRPHFLFNSMNTIASLTRSQPAQAEAAVENLADLFRISLSDARQRLTLAEELQLCRRYLEIEHLRLGERLLVEWHTDNLPEDALLPALLLQPLLENAVYHGVEPLTEGGTVIISGEQTDNLLSITVQNPVAASADMNHQKGNQLAQENIRERLHAVYGHQGKLQTESSNGSYKVIIQFPYENQLDENSDR